MPNLILASALAFAAPAAAPSPAPPPAPPPTVAAAAPSPQLSLQQQTGLRCAAAFAVVAARQERGDRAAQAWPAMNPRGKEFFVRTGARLMDETGMTREQLGTLFAAEATVLTDQQTLGEIMPGCLLLLDASGI